MSFYVFLARILQNSEQRAVRETCKQAIEVLVKNHPAGIIT
jgi:hypothetical protein